MWTLRYSLILWNCLKMVLTWQKRDMECVSALLSVVASVNWLKIYLVLTRVMDLVKLRFVKCDGNSFFNSTNLKIITLTQQWYKKLSKHRIKNIYGCTHPVWRDPWNLVALPVNWGLLGAVISKRKETKMLFMINLCTDNNS